jgi:hypothetical protein
MKARTRLSGELLQGFAAIIEQLAHRALVKLPQSFIQRKAAYAFINEQPGCETAPPHGW